MARAFNIPASSGIVGPGSTGTASPQVTSDARYMGHGDIRETAGFVVTVRLREGSVTGAVLASMSLNSSTQNAVSLAPTGVMCRGGVYCQLSGTGTIEGSVWID